ncbi:MAG: hypothetical protein V6Z81_06555 [Parvularculales bacterium]
MKNSLRFSVAILFVVFTTLINAFGEVPPAPSEKEVGVSWAHAGGDSTIGVSIGVPFEHRINGYLIAETQHIHVDGETESVQRLLYTEVGLPVRRFEVNAFAKGLRNTERDVDLQTDFGYFLQLPEIQRRLWSFSAGLGNFARNEIPELAAEAETTFNWTAFIRVRNARGVSMQYQVNIGVDGSDLEHSFTKNSSLRLGERLSLNVNLTLMFADNDVHTASRIGAKLRF